MMNEEKEQQESIPEVMKEGGNIEEEAAEKTDYEEGKKEKHARHKHHKDDKNEKLEAEVAQLNDKYLRLYSEFDNYRKRTIKEKIELGKTASADVILSILPVVDDFERAIKAFEISDESADALKHGIILVYNKFINILSQQGVKAIKSIGEEFNTDFHEAVTQVPASDPEMKGRVIDETEKGYMLFDKVIRYSKVIVAN